MHSHLGLQLGPPIPSRAAAPSPNRFWPQSNPEHSIHTPHTHNLHQYNITEAIIALTTNLIELILLRLHVLLVFLEVCDFRLSEKARQCKLERSGGVGKRIAQRQRMHSHFGL